MDDFTKTIIYMAWDIDLPAKVCQFWLKYSYNTTVSKKAVEELYSYYFKEGNKC